MVYSVRDASNRLWLRRFKTVLGMGDLLGGVPWCLLHCPCEDTDLEFLEWCPVPAAGLIPLPGFMAVAVLYCAHIAAPCMLQYRRILWKGRTSVLACIHLLCTCTWH